MIVGGGPAGTMARRRVPPLVAEAAAAMPDGTSRPQQKQPSAGSREETSATHEALRVGGASWRSQTARHAERRFCADKPPGGRGSHIGLTHDTRRPDHHRTYEVVRCTRLRARRCRRRDRRLSSCGPQARLLPHDEPGVRPACRHGTATRWAAWAARIRGRATAAAGRLPRTASPSGSCPSVRQTLARTAARRGPRARLTIESMKRFKAVVIGGSGYGGAEMIRRLLIHPEVELVRVVAVDHVGEPLGAVHPPLTGAPTCGSRTSRPPRRRAGCDVALLALPHKVSAQQAPEHPGRGREGRRHVGRLPPARRRRLRAATTARSTRTPSCSARSSTACPS